MAAKLDKEDLDHKLAMFEELRAQSESLPRGAAPFTSSDSFKIPSSGLKQDAKRCDHRWSNEGRARGRATLKASVGNLDPSAVISLATARPAAEFYPWQSMTMLGANPSNHGDQQATEWYAVMSCTKGEDAYDLGVAMNYGYGRGSPQVLRFVTEHVELMHNPPYSDWSSCLTCGTTSALEMAFRILCNRGEWILAEEYTYSGAVEAAKGLGIRTLGVKMDNNGLRPDDLESKLCNWDAEKGPKPFVLYTIPSGQNPTGTTQPLERRRAIYQIAERHDLYIVEDDPYYFLQLEESIRGPATERSATTPTDDYIAHLPASYLSLDVSGRVIRLDSTSKILAPGLRCGWMTACSQLIEKFTDYTDVSTTSPSGPSQLMMYKLLDETWGHEGFINWLKYLSLQYSSRRNIMVEACKRYLPSEICHWTVPTVGMFLWVRAACSMHPEFRGVQPSEGPQVSALDIEDRVHVKAKAHGVVVSKGSWFQVERTESSHAFFRLTFAAAPEDSLELGVERFGAVLRAEFMLD